MRSKRLFIVWVFSFFVSCSLPKHKNEEGQQLTKLYCGSCHQVPSPSQLDKKTWVLGVLPKMGPRLGVYAYGGYNYEVNKNSPGLPLGFYPDSAALSIQDWGKIVNYFHDEAPDSLHAVYPPIDLHSNRFEVIMPAFPMEYPPVSSLVNIDTANHFIYVANGIELKIRSFNQHAEKIDETSTITVPVGLVFDEKNKSKYRSGILLNMGALSPFDVSHGSLQVISYDKNHKMKLSSDLLIDELQRPVHISVGDLDGDKKDDIVVCGFGNFTGELFWLRNTGDGHYEKKSFRQFPGAIQSIITDINKDGRQDILALMAQGDEGVFAYEQQIDGSFREKRIMQFSPVAGSISMDLVDFNKDGFLDLLYTSGDNADYSKVLKPYHGVYIFLNDGKWNFKQKYFFPINGCFKAVARDFDLDGDPDIAAISYFADFKNRPEESFVYLQNEGNYQFRASTIPEHSIGRWLTLDVGDLDADGDQDIVLGNMSIGPSNFAPNRNWRRGPEFILLKNTTRKAK